MGPPRAPLCQNPRDQVCVAHGPGMPPDPWDQVRVAHVLARRGGQVVVPMGPGRLA